MSAYALIFAFPRTPFYRGHTPEKASSISGAQNLSDLSSLLPAHWGLGLQKLRLVQFRACAWGSEPTLPGRFPLGISTSPIVRELWCNFLGKHQVNCFFFDAAPI